MAHPHTHIHTINMKTPAMQETCNAENFLILGSGRSPGEENSSPLQYSCLGNPMDREPWLATVHGVTQVGQNLVTKSAPSHMCDTNIHTHLHDKYKKGKL